MAKYRRGRINEEISRELSQIIRTVKDPRVGERIISITAVDCTADLKLAKIYYSPVDEGDPAELSRGLSSASGYLRSQLAKRMNLRETPELRFIADDSIATGARINELLHKLNAESSDKSDGE